MAQQQIGGQTCPPPYPAPPPREEAQPAPVIRPNFERRTSGDHGYAPVPAEEVEREETPSSSQKSSSKSSTSSSETGTEASPKAPPPQRTRASASASSAAAATSASAAASAPARLELKHEPPSLISVKSPLLRQELLKERVSQEQSQKERRSRKL